MRTEALGLSLFLVNFFYPFFSSFNNTMIKSLSLKPSYITFPSRKGCMKTQ